jgi:hypothetical protein
VTAADVSNRLDRVRQGEVVIGLREPRVQQALPLVAHGQTFSVDWIIHPISIVITADCDLLGDHRARESPQTTDRAEAQRLARQLDHVTFCRLYFEDDLRANRFDRDVWRRVRQNQDVRYHAIPSPHVPGFERWPVLYVDFTKTFMMQTLHIHHAIQCNEIRRTTPIEQPWLQDLVNRWAHFHGRVCVPDPSDLRD